MMGEVIATLGVIEVNEFNDDTKSGDTSGKTFVDNFDNFGNFDNFKEKETIKQYIYEKEII